MPEENYHSYLSLLEILAIDICCFSITMMKGRHICIKPRWNVMYITVQMWSALHLTWLLLLIRVKPGDWLSGLTTKTHHLSLQKDHLKHMPGYIWAIISTTLESVCPCLCLKGGDPQVMFCLQIFFKSTYPDWWGHYNHHKKKISSVNNKHMSGLMWMGSLHLCAFPIVLI